MLLNQLNKEQRIAAEHTEGAVMIVAGAGSGKTRTLTYRIAHLLEKGVDPINILALTFTNKAATEMKDRVIELVGGDARKIMMGTFHSVFSRILRVEAERIGYVQNFTIYDTDDSRNLIKAILKENNLDPKQYGVNYIHSRISKAKNHLFSASDYLDNKTLMKEDKDMGLPLIGNIFQEYNIRLRRAMAMDFDDLLFNMNILLRDHQDILLKYQDRFRYIHVDEYQDTNYSQYLIVNKLASRHRNICVVGDDAQSIYAFRGADIRNILNFKQVYSESKIIKLEQNYRSTQNIVNAANSLIAQNKKQIKKTVWTSNNQGDKVVFKELDSDKAEAMWIARHIKTKAKDGSDYKDFALLYRTNQQSRALEEALRFSNIPYRILSGTSFYDRMEIKDVIAYFRLVSNHKDDEAFVRIINFPARGIGDVTINKLREIAASEKKSLFEIADNLKDYDLSISPRTSAKIAEFLSFIKAFNAEMDAKDAYVLGSEIINYSGLLEYWKMDKDPLSEDRVNNIYELTNALNSFVEGEDEVLLDELSGEELIIQTKTLDIFLSQVSLMSELDRDDEKGDDRVVLMTVHASKGLEFPFVFVSGLEENLFPSSLSLGSQSDLEEERRLLYVAMTRAEKELYLSCAGSRYRHGQVHINERSRFLEEIDEEYLSEPVGTKPFANNFTQEAGLSKSPYLGNSTKRRDYSNKELPKPIGGEKVNIDDYEIDMNVLHSKFGKGRIVSLEGEGDNAKAEVDFLAVGKKKLVLRFAKLKKI